MKLSISDEHTSQVEDHCLIRKFSEFPWTDSGHAENGFAAIDSSQLTSIEERYLSDSTFTPVLTVIISVE